MRYFQKFLHRPYWALGTIGIIGLILRLINLSAQPLWGDEVLSLDIATYIPNLHQMLRYLAAVEVHPPLYYIMLHFLIAAGYGSGLAAKVLSLIFGLGCIIATYFLAKQIFSDKVGLIASLIVAVMPFQLEFSQEARPYIIFCFFGILASMGVWQYFRTQKRKYLVLYVAANIVGMYLHYSYIFILVSLAVWGFVEICSKPNYKKELGIWISANALIGLAFSFWLVPFLMKIILGQYDIFGWVRVENGFRPSVLLETSLSHLIWLTKHQGVSNLVIFIVFLAKSLLAISAIGALIKLRRSPKFEEYKPLLFVCWLLLGPLLLFLFSPQSIAYTVIYERHIIFITVPIAVLIAVVISRLTVKQSLAVGAVFLFSLVPFITEVLGNDAAWDQDYNLSAAGQFINEQYQPGDIVIVDYGFSRTDLTHYLKDNIPVYELLPINYYGSDEWATRHTLGFVENEYQSRFTVPTESEVDGKLNRLDAMYHPRRIWLYGFVQSDYPVHHWFSDGKWRSVYQNIQDVFRVDLYART